MSQADVPKELRSHGGESAEELKRLRKAREKFRKSRKKKRGDWLDYAMRDARRVGAWGAF